MTMQTRIPRSTESRQRAYAAALLLAAGALAAHAGPTPPPKASKSESAGVASGLAVGAAAGGPIGAILGAAAGGWLGDRMHRERTAHERTRSQLTAASLRGSGLSMNLMFRTDESRLQPDDAAALAQFAALAATTPGAVVHVTGFADPRGSATCNTALAAARASAVASRLVAAGLPFGQLVVSSETAGDVATLDPAATTATPDLDGYAFQRRVTVRIGQGTPGEARVAQK